MSIGDTKNYVAQAIAQLGRELGAQADGETLIVPFDDLHECVVQPAREGAQVVIESALLIVFEESRDAIIRSVMRCNADPSRVAGGTVYLDRATSALVLRAETPVGPDGGEGLGRAVAGFIEHARRVLGEISAAVSPAAADSLEGVALLRG